MRSFNLASEADAKDGAARAVLRYLIIACQKRARKAGDPSKPCDP